MTAGAASSQQGRERSRIAIVGGGIGGLTAAIALRSVGRSGGAPAEAVSDTLSGGHLKPAASGEAAPSEAPTGTSTACARFTGPTSGGRGVSLARAPRTDVNFELATVRSASS